jgi:hypothetical protein
VLVLLLDRCHAFAETASGFLFNGRQPALECFGKMLLFRFHLLQTGIQGIALVGADTG